MLASVFRRLYYTNKVNFEDLFIKMNERSKLFDKKPVEENKEQNFKFNIMSHRKRNSNLHSEIQIGYEDT